MFLIVGLRTTRIRERAQATQRTHPSMRLVISVTLVAVPFICTRKLEAVLSIPTSRPLDMFRVDLLVCLSFWTRRFIVAEFPVSLNKVLVSHSARAFLCRHGSLEPTSVLIRR